MPTLLVVGGSGLLGSRLVEAARKDYRVIGTHQSSPPPIEGVEWLVLHKENFYAAGLAVERIAPDIIIDTAAFHDVDACEADRERAWRVNADATRSLAEAAHEQGSRYVFISTDFVFSGAKGSYAETDVPHPVNRYGASKLAGEWAVLHADERNQVIRPSVVFGWNPSRLNFATWVLTSLRDGKSIQIVRDWWGSPTWADALAQGILALARLPDGGIFHLAGPDRMSRYDFALQLADAFELDPEDTLIRPVSAARFIGKARAKAPRSKARRPRDSSLAIDKAAEHGVILIDYAESLYRMHKQQDLKDFKVPTRYKS